MLINDFKPQPTQHCETNTTGNLLRAAGLELSEPMLFGLGEGLAYGVFSFKNVPIPLLAGRSKMEGVTCKLSQWLDFSVEYRQTRSPKKAWENIASFIDRGQPVGAKLNARFLDYFSSEVDFAAHYVAVYGYDDDRVFVVDTASQGGLLSTHRKSFEEGRLWRGPMASHALTWTLTVDHTDIIDWPRVLLGAITANARAYLAPPIANFGASGIRKTARSVLGWAERYELAAIALAGRLMERGGTGGSLFRCIYRDFLVEANHHLQLAQLTDAAQQLDAVARLWTQVSETLERVAVEGPALLHEASELLDRLADLEEAAVETLATLSIPERALSTSR